MLTWKEDFLVSLPKEVCNKHWALITLLGCNKVIISPYQDILTLSTELIEQVIYQLMV